MEEEQDKNNSQQEEIPQDQPEETTPKEENVDYKEAWMRATADYQNLKKDVGEMQAQYTRYANQRLLEDLIPVIEHFHQGMKYIPEEVLKENWMVGFTQIKKQLDEFMERNHLERIETVGAKFDPLKHEAVQSRTEEGKSEGEILEEISGGYELNEKVLQPARVIIAE